MLVKVLELAHFLCIWHSMWHWWTGHTLQRRRNKIFTRPLLWGKSSSSLGHKRIEYLFIKRPERIYQNMWCSNLDLRPRKNRGWSGLNFFGEILRPQNMVQLQIPLPPEHQNRQARENGLKWMLYNCARLRRLTESHFPQGPNHYGPYLTQNFSNWGIWPKISVTGKFDPNPFKIHIYSV